MSGKPASEDLLYSDQVLQFLKASAEYCTLLEEAPGKKRKEWFSRLREVLADLYSTGLKLPRVESVLDESNQKFVTEEDYNRIQGNVLKKMGSFNEYPEVFNPEEPIEELQVTASAAEDLADVYQDIRDFMTLFNLGNREVMNDALWEVNLNFDRYWGQKLLNVLRLIHRLITWGDITDEELEDSPGKPGSQDTSNWFISRRQQEFNDNDEPVDPEI